MSDKDAEECLRILATIENNVRCSVDEIHCTADWRAESPMSKVCRVLLKTTIFDEAKKLIDRIRSERQAALPTRTDFGIKRVLIDGAWSPPF